MPRKDLRKYPNIAFTEFRMRLREVTTYETEYKTFMKTLIYFQKINRQISWIIIYSPSVSAIRDLYK